jgi:hypothetical protein
MPLTTLLLAALAAGEVAPVPPLGVIGSAPVSAVVRLDYQRDGVIDNVQFWIHVDARAAVGTPDTAGYVAGSGTLRYFMLDVERRETVENWTLPLDMSGQAPDREAPVTDLVVDGRTATFEAFGMRWRVVDGGEGAALDTVEIDDGFRKKTPKFTAGDFRVGPVQDPAAP